MIAIAIQIHTHTPTHTQWSVNQKGISGNALNYLCSDTCVGLPALNSSQINPATDSQLLFIYFFFNFFFFLRDFIFKKTLFEKSTG